MGLLCAGIIVHRRRASPADGGNPGSGGAARPLCAYPPTWPPPRHPRHAHTPSRPAAHSLRLVQNWAFEAFVAFFVVFNAVPAILELLTFLFITRFSFLKY